MKQIKLIVLSVGILALLSFGGLAKLHPTESSTKLKTTPASVAVITAPPTPVSLPVTPASTITTSSGLEVPVLMYHRVGVMPDQASADLTLSQQDFENQVAYFKNKGYRSVSLNQVYNALTDQAPLPAKPVVFTFDDGYKDVFDNAIPVLLKNGYSGTFAIATELLGRPTYAVWDDVIKAQNSGMEIVSHTENHLDLTNPIYSEADLHREIYDSKTVLENKLNHPVIFFVYPYGRYNDRIVQLVKDAGYKMAFTTNFGLKQGATDLLAEPRVRVHGQDGLTKLQRIFEPWLFPDLVAKQVGQSVLVHSNP